LGARATAKDVGALTFFFKGAVNAFFPEPLDADSLALRELMVKTLNEILVRLEQGHDKLTGQDLEVIGFALRRVYFVAEAYKAERQKFTPAEWMEKLVGIAKEAGISATGL
jgi:hypothetical protein